MLLLKKRIKNKRLCNKNKYDFQRLAKQVQTHFKSDINLFHSYYYMSNTLFPLQINVKFHHTIYIDPRCKNEFQWAAQTLCQRIQSKLCVLFCVTKNTYAHIHTKIQLFLSVSHGAKMQHTHKKKMLNFSNRIWELLPFETELKFCKAHFFFVCVCYFFCNSH